MMLLGGPPGVASPIGKYKRIRQLPNDREFREFGEGRSRINACTSVFSVVYQRRVQVGPRRLLAPCSWRRGPHHERQHQRANRRGGLRILEGRSRSVPLFLCCGLGTRRRMANDLEPQQGRPTQNQAKACHGFPHIGEGQEDFPLPLLGGELSLRHVEHRHCGLAAELFTQTAVLRSAFGGWVGGLCNFNCEFNSRLKRNLIRDQKDMSVLFRLSRVRKEFSF